MVKAKQDRYQDHLLNLYLKWEKEPIKYEQDMVNAVEGIARKTLITYGYSPVYWRIEDQEDLLQDLRIAGVQSLHKIKNPTNKRIYNYIKLTLQRVLIKRSYKLARYIDRESSQQCWEQSSETDTDFLDITDPKLRTIAKLISSYETEKSICEFLQISKEDFQQYTQQLREIYADAA